MSKENETLTDIEEEIRADQDPYSAKIAAELDEQTVGNRVVIQDAAQCLRDDEAYIKGLADRIAAARKRELKEIVDAISELRNGICLHCDLQEQCVEGEDGMPTTCNAMATLRNFYDRYKEDAKSENDLPW